MRAHLSVVFIGLQRPGNLECGLEEPSFLDPSYLPRVDGNGQRPAVSLIASPLCIDLIPVHLCNETCGAPCVGGVP